MSHFQQTKTIKSQINNCVFYSNDHHMVLSLVCMQYAVCRLTLKNHPTKFNLENKRKLTVKSHLAAHISRGV